MNTFVEKKGNKICIDMQYFNNVFIKPFETPNKETTSLSGLTFRLMAYLLTELSFYEPRKLLNRREIAKILGVNEASIHKGLYTLENNNFFKRTVDTRNNIMTVSGEHEKYCQSLIDEDRKKKNFKGFFILNPDYQQSYDDLASELIKQLCSNNCNFPQGKLAFSNDDSNQHLYETIITKFLAILLKDKELIQRLSEML